jgi:hypothetical protein
VRGRELPVDIYAIEGNEARRAPRVTLAAEVRIEDGDVIVVVPLLDISRTGVAVAHPPRAIEAGRVVKLTIALPGLSPPFEAEVRVAVRRDDRLGLAFVGLPPEEATRLDKILARHGAPP